MRVKKGRPGRLSDPDVWSQGSARTRNSAALRNYAAKVRGRECHIDQHRTCSQSQCLGATSRTEQRCDALRRERPPANPAVSPSLNTVLSIHWARLTRLSPSPVLNTCRSPGIPLLKASSGMKCWALRMSTGDQLPVTSPMYPIIPDQILGSWENIRGLNPSSYPLYPPMVEMRTSTEGVKAPNSIAHCYALGAPTPGSGTSYLFLPINNLRFPFYVFLKL
ncbi:hypothetical protein E2C01_018608 [Portunus trituberculatus]|uniref:Uncharacterized protein n=1 Tax=Portunus trituberculatus TaxID=210409 RepID=A0A5B7DUW7_PORTR|nr:hypothetical protein [Portunus trituberculatus]